MTNARVLPQSLQLLVPSSPPSVAEDLKHAVTTVVLVARSAEPCAEERWGLWEMQGLDRPAVSRGPGICITGAQVTWLLLVFLTSTPAPGLGTSLDTASQDPQGWEVSVSRTSTAPRNAKTGSSRGRWHNGATPGHPPARVPFSHSFVSQAPI